MGRGSSKAGSTGGGGSSWSQTPEVEKTLKGIIRQTANLKNEQYRVIDDSGDVVFTRKGSQGEVIMTVGEKRQYLDGATTIHNHPEREGNGMGGTFSSADIGDFGYGAKEIVIATPEGTYRLKNTKWGTPQAKDGWVGLREGMYKLDKKAQDQSFLEKRNNAAKKLTKERKAMEKVADEWVKRRNAGASESELKALGDKWDSLNKDYQKKLKREQRKDETKPYHDYLKKYAKKYGFEYSYPKGVDR